MHPRLILALTLYGAALALFGWSLIADAGHDGRWLAALLCASAGLLVTLQHLLASEQPTTETEI